VTQVPGDIEAVWVDDDQAEAKLEESDGRVDALLDHLDKAIREFAAKEPKLTNFDVMRAGLILRDEYRDKVETEGMECLYDEQ